MRLALRRWLRVNDETPEPGSALAGSTCTLVFPQQFRHLVPGFQFANCVVTLNPETRGLRNNVVSWGESHGCADFRVLVRTSAQDLAMKNHHHSEQRRIRRYQSGRGFRVVSQFFKSDVRHGA